MPLSVLQSRFLKTWRLSGGRRAAYEDLIQGRFSDHTISVVCKDGVGWVYDHVGRNHHEANGVRLQGEVMNALPADEIETRLELYNNLVATGQPMHVEEIGITGLSRRTWTSRVYVATKPPLGASAAVVGVCEWQEDCDVLNLEIVLGVVERLCPGWIADIFRAKDPSTLLTRAKILEMIAAGDFGEVPASDLASISQAIGQLKNSVELGASSGIGLT